MPSSSSRGPIPARPATAADIRFWRSSSSARASQRAFVTWLARMVLKSSEAEPPKKRRSPVCSLGWRTWITPGDGLRVRAFGTSCVSPHTSDNDDVDACALACGVAFIYLRYLRRSPAERLGLDGTPDVS